MAAKKKITFEAGLERLEALVRQMESGELPLEESFEAYGQGIALADELKNLLDAGEKRITELSARGETLFAPEEENP